MRQHAPTTDAADPDRQSAIRLADHQRRAEIAAARREIAEADRAAVFRSTRASADDQI